MFNYLIVVCPHCGQEIDHWLISAELFNQIVREINKGKTTNQHVSGADIIRRSDTNCSYCSLSSPFNDRR